MTRANKRHAEPEKASSWFVWFLTSIKTGLVFWLLSEPLIRFLVLVFVSLSLLSRAVHHMCHVLLMYQQCVTGGVEKSSEVE